MVIILLSPVAETGWQAHHVALVGRGEEHPARPSVQPTRQVQFRLQPRQSGFLRVVQSNGAYRALHDIVHANRTFWLSGIHPGS